MDLRTEILREHSKAQAVKIASYIGDNQVRFDELMVLFFEETYRVSQRAAWIVSHCTDAHIHLIEPHLEALVLNLQQPKLHDAIKRNSLRILAMLSIPEDLQGVLLNSSFDFLLSQKEAIAIKVHAMQIAYNISQSEPDLLRELKMVIEDQMPYGSTGFKSRGRRLLAGIQKILDEV